MVRGKDRVVYLYKVPALAYKEEDIYLEFLLSTMSGTSPLMFAAFCDKDEPSICIEYALKAQLNANGSRGDSSQFKIAKMLGKDLSLIIDHDEKVCKEDYDSNCYYTIVVLG